MSVVLHYFDSWGRAERIRWFFMLHNIEFVDRRYEWEEWCNIRDTVEFGQLPILEIDGHSLVQSLAFERYLAKKLNMTPSDPYQEYLVDSMVACFDDYFRHVASFLIYTSDLEGYVSYYESELKANLKWVEKRIEVNGNNGFVVGTSRTFADYAIAEFIHDVFLSGPRKGTLGPLISAGNPALVKFTEDFINSHPQLKTYLSTRPDRDY